MRKKHKIMAMAGTIAAVGVAAAASVPTVSQQDVESRLREFGVPDGAEIVAAQAVADGGPFLTVVYRDAAGELQTIGGVERLATPPPD